VKVWKVILVTLVIFGAGVVAGGVLATRSQSASTEEITSKRSNQPPQQGMKPERALRMDFVDRLKKELHLTAEQLSQVEGIVQESQKRTREIWEECSPQMRAEFKATKEKINAVLNEEQRELFREMMMKHRPPHKDDKDREELPPPRDFPPREPPPE